MTPGIPVGVVIPSVGPLELGIVLLVVLLIFGPKRLPSLGRQLGSGLREFRDSITRRSDHEEEDGGDGTGGPSFGA